MKVGDRVGAILGSKEREVEFFGFGVYEGDFLPVGAVGDVAEVASAVAPDRLNPKIKLDSGKVVWGCECWWGPEENIKAQIERWEKIGFTIIEKDIDEVRKEHAFFAGTTAKPLPVGNRTDRSKSD